ncbi:MAG: APC family permease [Rhodomicrobium sp.]
MNQADLSEPAVAIALKDKGLKRSAISLLSNLVIGMASAAPAYSLASALGTIAGIAALATPAIMAIAFIPMLFIATAYFYLNRADPDCGTTFAWVTRAMGPHMGWIGGWALLVTNILVMPSLAVIAGQYSFQLFGYGQPSTLGVTIAGVAWIAIMTAICYLGIEVSARTQQVLLGTELVILLVFAGAALSKVYLGDAPAGAVHPSLKWSDPLEAGSADNIVEALLVAVFIYWGWDTGVSVNEETEDPEIAPGRAAIASTLLLLVVYVFVTVAAIAFAGPVLLSQNKDDIFAPIGESVLGPWLDKLLVLAVLTSASAATQTTILPAARTALSMAAAGAIPARFGEINPRYQSPGFATLVMGGVSIAWYAGLTFLSKNVLSDSILALGLCIAFYYALTGFACPILYRRQLLRNLKNFVFMGVLPTAGGLMMLFLFVESALALSKTGSSAIFGVATPLAIGAGSLLAGVLMMLWAQWSLPAFFRQKPE